MLNKIEQKGDTMFFIGHFSFDQIGANKNPKHGYLSSIVAAENPSEAISDFKKHIYALKESQPEFNDVVHVYIEDIVRVAQVPKTPITIRLQSCEGGFPASVSHTLPGYTGERIDAFGLRTEVEAQEAVDDDRFIESEPFITFDA
jgi:hypothetical protein